MKFDFLIHGAFADQYTSDQIKKYITEEYIKRHTPVKTPYTHPLDYDPLCPPSGWRYDPYDEIWVKL